jgi:hypothetical protein
MKPDLEPIKWALTALLRTAIAKPIGPFFVFVWPPRDGSFLPTMPER